MLKAKALSEAGKVKLTSIDELVEYGIGEKYFKPPSPGRIARFKQVYGVADINNISVGQLQSPDAPHLMDPRCLKSVFNIAFGGKK